MVLGHHKHMEEVARQSTLYPQMKSINQLKENDDEDGDDGDILLNFFHA
jgi:hypothetical protein